MNPSNKTALSVLANELTNNDPDKILYYDIHNRIAREVYDELKARATEMGLQNQFNKNMGLVMVACARIPKNFLESLIKEHQYQTTPSNPESC